MQRSRRLCLVFRFTQQMDCCQRVWQVGGTHQLAGDICRSAWLLELGNVLDEMACFDEAAAASAIWSVSCYAARRPVGLPRAVTRISAEEIECMSDLMPEERAESPSVVRNPKTQQFSKESSNGSLSGLYLRSAAARGYMALTAHYSTQEPSGWDDHPI
jgi:hypothetical protein